MASIQAAVDAREAFQGRREEVFRLSIEPFVAELRRALPGETFEVDRGWDRKSHGTYANPADACDVRIHVKDTPMVVFLEIVTWIHRVSGIEHRQAEGTVTAKLSTLGYGGPLIEETRKGNLSPKIAQNIITAIQQGRTRLTNIGLLQRNSKRIALAVQAHAERELLPAGWKITSLQVLDSHRPTGTDVTINIVAVAPEGPHSHLYEMNARVNHEAGALDIRMDKVLYLGYGGQITF